jgi:hypothetical protein
MRHTWKSRILNKMFLVHVQTMTIPKAGTVGMSARVPYTVEYVLFLDYDNITDDRLIEELIVLQENYKLGDSHVLATNEYGRHVICIDRLPFREKREIMWASSCDYDFKRGDRINEGRTWILRVLDKGERDRPKYLYSIPSPYNGLRLQSQAHGLFLKYFYGADVRLTNPDGNNELEFQSYKTSSKVKLEDLIKKHKPSKKVKLEDAQKEAQMVQRG